ncbi:MAG: hypothetical protein WEC84_03805 [Candidatus Andersenbacteria bacterium]
MVKVGSGFGGGERFHFGPGGDGASAGDDLPRPTPGQLKYTGDQQAPLSREEERIETDRLKLYIERSNGDPMREKDIAAKRAWYEQSLFGNGREVIEERKQITGVLKRNAIALTERGQKINLGGEEDKRKMRLFVDFARDFRGSREPLVDLIDKHVNRATLSDRDPIGVIHSFGRLLMEEGYVNGQRQPFDRLPLEKQRVAELGQFITLEAERRNIELFLQHKNPMPDSRARKSFNTYRLFAQNEALPDQCRKAFALTAEKLSEQYPSVLSQPTSSRESRDNILSRVESGSAELYTQEIDHRIAERRHTNAVFAADMRAYREKEEGIPIDDNARALVSRDHVENFLDNLEYQREYAEWVNQKASLSWWGSVNPLKGIKNLAYRATYAVNMPIIRFEAYWRTFGAAEALRGIVQPRRATQMMAEVRRLAIGRIPEGETTREFEKANRVEQRKGWFRERILAGLGPVMADSSSGVASEKPETAQLDEASQAQPADSVEEADKQAAQQAEDTKEKVDGDSKKQEALASVETYLRTLQEDRPREKFDDWVKNDSDRYEYFLRQMKKVGFKKQKGKEKLQKAWGRAKDSLLEEYHQEYNATLEELELVENFDEWKNEDVDRHDRFGELLKKMGFKYTPQSLWETQIKRKRKSAA